MRASCLALIALTFGCTESGSSGRPSAIQTPVPCTAGQTRACACADGSPGTQRCDSQWTACECVSPDPPDFGEQPPPVAGTSGGVVDAGPIPSDRSCKPGFYLGTYSCDVELFGLPVPLMGDVSFNLSVNEDMVAGNCPPSEEFCPDLVISENSGTLFGLANFIGFETQLDGALDCETGEFRATGVDGRYGNPVSTDPNDPDALLTVEEPPLGMFDGMFMGTQKPGSAGASDSIEGLWNLVDITISGLSCEGPFQVELQP